MPTPKLYATANEPGYARVSFSPNNAGIRMTIEALILGLAKVGKSHIS